MTHITCRLTAMNRDQLQNPVVSNGVWASFTFFYVSIHCGCVTVCAASVRREDEERNGDADQLAAESSEIKNKVTRLYTNVSVGTVQA